MASKLKILLAFAEQGIGILPVDPETNSPAVAGGAKAAVTDVKTLRRFFKKHPTYYYGLALGSGVFAVLVNDIRAMSRLQRLAEEQGERLPKTVTLRIDDARVYFFRSCGLQVASATGLLGRGIDVIGTGDYVAGPGSALPSGSACRFAKNRTFDEVEIAAAPNWLSNLVATDPTDPTPVAGGVGDRQATPIAANTDAGDVPQQNFRSEALAGRSAAPTAGTSWDGKLMQAPTLQLVSIPISAISVDAKQQIDPEHRRVLEDSIGILGLRTPITVMRKKDVGAAAKEPIFNLVTGGVRIEAMRSRGAERVDVIIASFRDIGVVTGERKGQRRKFEEGIVE